jgi:hypothetical protein
MLLIALGVIVLAVAVYLLHAKFVKLEKRVTKLE